MEGCPVASGGFDLAAFVRASCERQGVPVLVSDAGIVGQVSALLGGGAGGAARRTPGAPRPTSSEAPDDLDSVRIEHSAAQGWGDDHSIDNGRNDGGLAGEGDAFPLGA